MEQKCTDYMFSKSNFKNQANWRLSRCDERIRSFLNLDYQKTTVIPILCQQQLIDTKTQTKQKNTCYEIY